MGSLINIGQIDYLNVRPLFSCLKGIYPPGSRLEYTPGHPAELNARLESGQIHMAPCSSFEFLAHPSSYRLLTDLSISAKKQVQSVLLVSPVPLEELPGFLEKNGNRLNLTTASATSRALLEILWTLHWKFPRPEFHDLPPGKGLHIHTPFLEIGDSALNLWTKRPKGWHLVDLASAWFSWTSLPFVFAVWIVRDDLDAAQKKIVADIHGKLLSCKRMFDENLNRYIEECTRPEWLTKNQLRSYWKAINYNLGPEEQASIVLFGHYCRCLNLISSCPALSWFQVLS